MSTIKRQCGLKQSQSIKKYTPRVELSEFHRFKTVLVQLAVS